MAFKKGQVVAFKYYRDRRFPKATEYHRVIRVEGKGKHAQVYTDDKNKRVSELGFFMAVDLRHLRKRELER